MAIRQREETLIADIDDLLNKQAQENEDERGADKWEPKSGDQLSGFIMKTGWYDGGDYEPSMWLLVKDEEGDATRVYCPTVLRNQVLEEAPAIGSGIAIRYEGKKPVASNPKRSYHAHTFVLVPDSDGNVKRDHAYWKMHGTYRGAQVAASTDDDDSFF